MKIFCVRIGDKYGPEYEEYINRKLSDYEVIWIREPFHPDVKLQWNKMLPMSYDLNEPVCVVDIDIILINDYHKIFDHPIVPGQFISSPNWWNPNIINFNGGFFKYYPKDCNYIFEEFMKRPSYWQQHFINIGVTSGPVNGEQHFVKMMAEQDLQLCRLPDAWFTRWTTLKLHEINVGSSPELAALKWEDNVTDLYKEKTGNDYIFDGDEFHPDIKFVHFTHSLNKPLDWELIENFYGIN